MFKKSLATVLFFLLPSTSGLSNEVLKVGISPWYFPVVFEDKTGAPTGIDADVSEAVAKILGAKVVFTKMPREKIGEAVATGVVDIGIGAVEERSYLRGYDTAKVDATKIKMVKYYDVPMAFVVQDAKLKTIENLKTKTVGTLAFFATRTDLATWNKKGAIGKVFGLENEGVLVDHFNKNRFDSIMVALPTALHLAAKSEKGWQVVKFTDSKAALREPLALIKSAATDAKSKKIAEAVEKFVKSNAIEDIAKKWIEVP